MLSNAQEFSAMLSNELQRGSKQAVLLKMLYTLLKKLMSSPPPSPPPSHPNQRIRGAPGSLGRAPKKFLTKNALKIDDFPLALMADGGHEGQSISVGLCT